MGRIFSYFWHILLSVAQGCLTFALVSGAVALLAVYLINRTVTNTDAALIIVIVLIAGALGSALALIWRLTHIKELAEVVSRVARSDAPRQ